MHSSCLSVARAATLVFLLLAAVCGGNRALAQVPLPNPNINLQAGGVIYAAATNPVDGSVIVGGLFTSIAGQPRQNLAKINADGTLDPTWNPGADGTVYALAIDNVGTVYAGGFFSLNIGGQPIRYLAKLSGTGLGAADPTWNPSPNGWSSNIALALDNNDSIYVASSFTNIGNQARQGLAKLSTSGTGLADITWNPAPDDDVLTLAVDGNGDVFAGGYFQTIGGQARSYLAKLSPTGTGAADSMWNPAPNNLVKALAVDVDSNVFVAGYFSNIGGQTRYALAKLSSSGAGAADPTWNPAPDSGVFALTLDGSGSIFVGGAYQNIGGQTRHAIAKLSATGTGLADTSWDAGTIVYGSATLNYAAPVNAIALTNAGNLIAGGTLLSVNGQQRLGLAALSITDASLLPATDSIRAGTVKALAAQPGGGMIVGGDFNLADSQQRNNLLRLQADGTLDPLWNSDADDVVNALAIDSSGSIYVAGNFYSIGGVNEARIAKLASDGSVNAGWHANVSSYSGILSLVLDSIGDAYIGGYFNYIAGQPRNYIAKLSGGTGLLDPNWNPGVDNAPSMLGIDNSNGWVYAGGYFENAGGGAHHYLARFSASGTGAVDANWNPNPDGQMNSLTIDNDGSVFVGGYFQNIGGQQRRGIAKLIGADGSADPNWNLSGYNAYPGALLLDGSGALYAGGCQLHKFSTSGNGSDPNYSTWSPSVDCSVNAIALDPNGNVNLGGNFTAVSGQSRTGLAALPPTAPPIPSSERAVLVDLYNNTAGTNWTNNTNWLGAIGTECAWFGVTCAGGHVTQIGLENNNLTGPLPALAALTELQSFNMRYNNLNGSIPAINSLSSLRTFLVEVNQLTGSIPDLSGMTALTSFGVGYNPLNGQIPALDSLTNLVAFWVQGANLTGPIPSLSGLSQLNTFWVQDNQLTGSIPSLDGLTNLYYFTANNNQLSGTVPDLAGLTNLGYFNINSNQISGQLPTAPASLVGGGSTLCPNALAQTPDPAWDAATGSTPWYSACTDAIFGNGFE
jgi:uncharacterized delta-60 repeat protein